jgi:hypothetical protein
MKCKGRVSFVGEVHHDDSARREVHEQTAMGGCECIDHFNNGTVIAANPPFIVFEVGTTPTASSYFVTSLEL